MNDEWCTPIPLYQEITEVFRFGTDVAATAENALCEQFFTRENSAFDHHWRGTCWMNPPYGRGQLERWTEKAVTETRQRGCTIVGLLPAVTDTAFWHDYVVQAQEIIFLRGRVHFDGPQVGAPTFGSALVIWRPIHSLSPRQRVHWWDWRYDSLRVLIHEPPGE